MFKSYNPLEVREINVTVLKKEIKGGVYLIFTINEELEKETFRNEDNYVFNKLNSSILYDEIKLGSKYTFVVLGKRSDYISEYRNILRIKSRDQEGK